MVVNIRYENGSHPKKHSEEYEVIGLQKQVHFTEWKGQDNMYLWVKLLDLLD